LEQTAKTAPEVQFLEFQKFVSFETRNPKPETLLTSEEQPK